MMQRDTQATGKQLSAFWKCNETCSQRSLAKFVASDFRIFAKYLFAMQQRNLYRSVRNIITMFINAKTFRL